MKKFLTQSIAIIALFVIVGLASLTSAGNPAIPPPSPRCDPTSPSYTQCLASTNTPLPVNVGSDPQYKGGNSLTNSGLAVEAFIAKQNATFWENVGIGGILTGGLQSTNRSDLYFGWYRGTANDRVVDVAVSGDTYTQNGGLYSQSVSGQDGKRLCADTNGVIIFCPPGTVIPPPPIVITGTLAGLGHAIKITLNSPVPPHPAVTFTEVQSIFDVSGTPTDYVSDITIVTDGATGSDSPAGIYNPSCIYSTDTVGTQKYFIQSSGNITYKLLVPDSCN